MCGQVITCPPETLNEWKGNGFSCTLFSCCENTNSTFTTLHLSNQCWESSPILKGHLFYLPTLVYCQRASCIIQPVRTNSWLNPWFNKNWNTQHGESGISARKPTTKLARDMQCGGSPSARCNWLSWFFAVPGWFFIGMLVRRRSKHENLMGSLKSKIDSMGKRLWLLLWFFYYLFIY